MEIKLHLGHDIEDFVDGSERRVLEVGLLGFVPFDRRFEFVAIDSRRHSHIFDGAQHAFDQNPRSIGMLDLAWESMWTVAMFQPTRVFFPGARSVSSCPSSQGLTTLHG